MRTELQCDVCKKEINNLYYDGKTTMGPWANMCSVCYGRYGVGLGIGKGQKYLRQENGDFLQIAGGTQS